MRAPRPNPHLNPDQVVEALLISVVQLLAFIGGSLAVADGRGEDAGAVFDEKLCHVEVVAGRRAMQRGPAVGVRCIDVAPVQEMSQSRDVRQGRYATSLRTKLRVQWIP